MKLVKEILESIRKPSFSALETIEDLDHEAVAELFERGIREAGLDEITVPSYGVMFIFPDGRMLGDRGARTSGGGPFLLRGHHHYDLISLLKHDPRVDIEGFNAEMRYGLAKYYNLIICARSHIAGVIMVPYGVDPTDAQLKRIRQFEARGYSVAYDDGRYNKLDAEQIEADRKKKSKNEAAGEMIWPTVDQLKNGMISGEFIELSKEVFDKYQWDIAPLYLFPDGTIIGSDDPSYVEHDTIYNHLPSNFDDYEHPTFDPVITRRYNLAVISFAGDGFGSKWIFMPSRPSSQQREIAKYLSEKGWNVYE